MAAITLPARTRTTEPGGRTSGSSRAARAGLTAVLLAIGIGPRSGRPPPQTAKSAQAPQIGAKLLLLTLYHRITEDRVLAISAGVTFYALLAVFPAIAAMVSIYGLFADLSTIHADLSSLGSVLPGGAIAIVGEQIKNIASNGHKALGFAVIGGILVSLWSANAGVKAIFDALNIILKEHEKRGFIRLNLASLAFTVGGILFILLAVGAVLAVPLVLKFLGANSMLNSIADIGRWPLVWCALTLGIALLYRFGPSRNDIPWRWISWGSAIGAIVWLVASMAFSWYAANFGTYNKTYGSLGAAIGFMTWLWISAIIVLVGEELNETLDKLRHPHKQEQDRNPLPARTGRRVPA